ncbi:MAG: hypothetical protein K0S79_107 [Nitrospira sp.]|jgi:hypothetical protein|nr:hypothetical protein [Nitrospira sp.]
MYCDNCKQGMLTRIMRDGNNAKIFSTCRKDYIGWIYIATIKGFFKDL